jgi:hypothetical protein
MDINSTIAYFWKYGGTQAALIVTADQDFTTIDGELVKAGQYKDPHICTVAPGSIKNQIDIPAITLPTTTDSPSNPDARWTARFFDYSNGHVGTERDIWLANFKLPNTFNSPTDWPPIFNYNNPPGPPPPVPGITFDQALALIQQALVGRSIQAEGTATIIPDFSGASVTISSSLADVNSDILVSSLSNNVTGALRVPREEIVPGVSFTIRSNNGGDFGTVLWALLG